MAAADLRREAVDALWAAGCVSADDEADLLIAAAAGDQERLRGLVARRSTGEPLAWIVGSIEFCDRRVAVHPGVYVPRPQSEALARAAADLLPERGTAVDLCTGSGAIAVAVAHARPLARVLGTELDPRAIACARANGVEVVESGLGSAAPVELAGQVDVVCGVVPYVPTGSIGLLPRDVQDHEPVLALDGGPDGTDLLGRAIADAARLLRPGGRLLLELGGDQDALVAPLLGAHGFVDVTVHRDDHGDLRRISAARPG